MNMAISGNRGTGKTSVLVKFEDIAKNNGCLCLRISNYEGNIENILDFTDYISSNLKRELLSRRPLDSRLKSMQDWVNTLKPTISWNDFSLSVERKEMVVQEMLRERLLKLWNEMDDEFDACVILIDEAESLEKIEGVLTFLREVFQRLAPDANYMVVLAGKLNFPERMSESFSPLNRFFPCFRLKPLTRDEIRTYLIKKLASESVGIDEDAITYIAEKSEGHPYVLVAMSHFLFDSMNDNEMRVTIDIVLRSEAKIKARLAEDFFRPMYHPLTPKAKSIIRQIARNTPGLEFNFRQSLEFTKMPKNFVSPYIKELLRKGAINKPERGKYQIFHSLFKEYLKELPDDE